MSPIIKRLLLKYIHQDLDICLEIHPGDTPYETQCSSDRKFIPEELHKLFGCQRLSNYSYIITAANNGNLAIGGTPSPTIG